MASCWMWRGGMAIWWHQYHAMTFVVGISSGQRQLSPWARKDSLIISDQMMQKRVNFQNSTQRWSHSQYWHTFSTELFFADRSPSSSTGLVYSMHIFTNIPVIKLECVFLYFECFFIAWGPHLPIVTSFCCFVKEEGKTRTMEDALIITITLLGWISETVEDGDFLPFRAMPSQITPLGNKILLCPVWICILQALKRSNFHCMIQPILVGWKTCWATLYLGGFSPLFIFLISPASICTSDSNSVLCDLRVTFLSSYEISVTGKSVNVWEIEMNLGVAVKKITILRAQPLPIWAQCPSFTGLWFPAKVDKAIWVQLFHLDNLWRSQGRSRGKAQELNSVLLQFLTKIGTRSIWASLEMAVPHWRRGSDAQCICCYM